MSVVVDAATITKPLWQVEAASASVSAKGGFLHVLNEPKNGTVTCFVFNPIDETRAAFGNSKGFVYGISLANNRVFLLGATAGSSIRSLVFCGGYSFSLVAVISSGNILSVMDWKTGRMHHRVVCGSHQRPITRIVSSPANPQFIACMSADAISCWTSESNHPVGYASEKNHASYYCLGTCMPSQCHLEMSTGGGSPAAPVQHEQQATGGFEPHRFLNIHIGKHWLYTIETNGIVSKWKVDRTSACTSSALQLEHSISTLPFRAACSTLLLVKGDDGSGASIMALGSKDFPLVSFVQLDSMEGSGILRLQDKKSANSTSNDNAGVQSISSVGGELAFCTLLDGRTMAVSARHMQAAFCMDAPKLVSRQPVAAWRFAASGPTYGVYWSPSALHYIHLATAKAFWESGELHDVDLYGHDAGEDVVAAEYDGDQVFATVRVTPFLRTARHNTGPEDPLATSDVSHRKKSQSMYRRPLSIDAKHAKNTWINVRLGAEKQSSSRREDERVLSVISKALYIDSISATACEFNMQKLREYLQKYGVFPSRYRPAIWRFVLGLPNKSKTAPQFASLARQPSHDCVSVLLEPFPLPTGPARTAVETVVSCLLHHSDIFSAATFLPTVVYPFSRVFKEDCQTQVEVMLTFFLNWGQDFLSCFPQPPAKLFTFLQRVLEKEDANLAQHLDTIGADYGIWGWDAVLTVYTDILTAPEWMQVMDHVFMMEPIWFYYFLIAYLVHARDILLPLCSAQEVLTELRRPHDSISLASVIVYAYTLYSADPRGNASCGTTEGYMAFRTFGSAYEYPVDIFNYDADLVAIKVKEAHDRAEAKRESLDAADRLRRLERDAEVAALREEALVREKQSRMAAKYESTSESWRAKVELERVRQACEHKERELRMATLGTTVSNAEKLSALTSDSAALDAQMRSHANDQRREERKWQLGAELTDAELVRLEKEASERISGVIAKELLGMKGGARPTPNDQPAPLAPVTPTRDDAVDQVRHDKGVNTAAISTDNTPSRVNKGTCTPSSSPVAVPSVTPIKTHKEAATSMIAHRDSPEDSGKVVKVAHEAKGTIQIEKVAKPEKKDPSVGSVEPPHVEESVSKSRTTTPGLSVSHKNGSPDEASSSQLRPPFIYSQPSAAQTTFESHIPSAASALPTPPRTHPALAAMYGDPRSSNMFGSLAAQSTATAASILSSLNQKRFTALQQRVQGAAAPPAVTAVSLQCNNKYPMTSSSAVVSAQPPKLYDNLDERSLLQQAKDRLQAYREIPSFTFSTTECTTNSASKTLYTTGTTATTSGMMDEYSHSTPRNNRHASATYSSLGDSLTTGTQTRTSTSASSASSKTTQSSIASVLERRGRDTYYY